MFEMSIAAKAEMPPHMVREYVSLSSLTAEVQRKIGEQGLLGPDGESSDFISIKGDWSPEAAFSEGLSALRRYHSNTSEVLERFVAEWTGPVGEVPREFVRLGVGEPWVWSRRMEEFYHETDGFVYELLNWHHRPNRIRWRRQLAQEISPNADVLCVGDGLGYDACDIAKICPDARVTSFEYAGYSSVFARRMIEDLRLANITQTTEIPNRQFDVVISLDVLEHVPDPEMFVTDIAKRLRPHGIAYISEACLWVRPTHPTHLRSNLFYAGRILPLFEKHNLSYRGMLDQPLTRIRIFEKDGERHSWTIARLRHRLGGIRARYHFHRLYPRGTTDMAAFVASANT
jgi:2-polyprenyl-3-methyl-5-hydroxy-6-metoxy-1,4-benzoquinol methylase